MGADHHPLVLLTGASGYIGGAYSRSWRKRAGRFAAWLGDLIYSDQKLPLPRKSLKQIA